MNGGKHHEYIEDGPPPSRLRRLGHWAGVLALILVAAGCVYVLASAIAGEWI
jgi:hypothetical protein